MNQEALIERLFETLIAGDRPGTRRVVNQAEDSVGSPEELVSQVLWPTYQLVEKLYRADQLTALNHHCAIRLLRMVVDQTAGRLTIGPARNRSILAFCGPSDADELGAQMAADLLEGAGFQVVFAGGGIATDEILGRVQESEPDVLLMFSSSPQDLPGIRQLVDQLREINACPNLQVAVGGGVFNRAEGLAEEIGADLWATTPLEMVETLVDSPDRRAAETQRTVGRNRRKRAAA